MNKKSLKNVYRGILLSLALLLFSTNVFAWGGGPGGGPGDDMHRDRERYHFRDGRFYRPGWFNWFEIVVNVPPIGAVVTELPAGHKIIIVDGARYYYYDNVYYLASSDGYLVVQEPVKVVKTVEVAPTETRAVKTVKTTGDATVINVPNSNGSFTPVKMVKYNDGYIGPQGEYYPGHPTVEQLKVLYGN